MLILKLENIPFRAFHGCLEEERKNGNDFLVSVSLTFDAVAAEQTDNMQDTANCQIIYNVIKAEMDKVSNLLENLARRIVNALKENFPQTKCITVSVSKLNPPFCGNAKKSAVEISETIN